MYDCCSFCDHARSQPDQFPQRYGGQLLWGSLRNWRNWCTRLVLGMYRGVGSARRVAARGGYEVVVDREVEEGGTGTNGDPACVRVDPR